MKPFKDFAAGSGYVFRGASYFAGKRDLWKYIVIPFIINLLILSVSLAVLTSYIGDITEYFRNFFGLDYKSLSEIAWYFKVLFLLYNALIWFVKLVVGIMAFVVWGIFLFIICQIITSPFYDLLSEKIEKHDGGSASELSLVKSLKLIPRILLTELSKMAILIVTPLCLLLLNFIPGIGSFLYLAASFIFTSVVYAFSFADYPQARKNEGLGLRIGFARRNFFLLLGFGLPVFIPFVNIFITPFMVTGGTLMWVERSNTQRT